MTKCLPFMLSLVFCVGIGGGATAQSGDDEAARKKSPKSASDEEKGRRHRGGKDHDRERRDSGDEAKRRRPVPPPEDQKQAEPRDARDRHPRPEEWRDQRYRYREFRHREFDRYPDRHYTFPCHYRGRDSFRFEFRYYRGERFYPHFRGVVREVFSYRRVVWYWPYWDTPDVGCGWYWVPTERWVVEDDGEEMYRYTRWRHLYLCFSDYR